MQKIGLFFSGLALSVASASAALTNDAAEVKTQIDTLTGNAEAVFDAVVPVILAVVGLGVLLTFIKMIKKR